MRVSIIITNYNYRRYLKHAVGSALRQTHQDVEVVVVDDGSTDGSQEVIREAAEADRRILAILKPNGGQASAMNAGFVESSGDIVFFLDADDMLMDDAAARVAAALTAEPKAVKVHFNLEVIDADGRPVGYRLPSRTPPCGDVKAAALAQYGIRTFGWPPTSGNAFPRQTLDRLLPIPEEVYRMCADQYLNYLSPLLGTIVALSDPAGCYRRHGTNAYCMWNEQQIDARFSRLIQDDLKRTVATRNYQLRLAEQLNGPALPTRPDVPATWRAYAIMRLMSLKLDPGGHPLLNDSLWHAARDAAVGCLRRSRNPGANLRRRLMEAAWVAAVMASPPSAAKQFIALKYFQAPKSWLLKPRR